MAQFHGITAFSELTVILALAFHDGNLYQGHLLEGGKGLRMGRVGLREGEGVREGGGKNGKGERQGVGKNEEGERW